MDYQESLYMMNRTEYFRNYRRTHRNQIADMKRKYRQIHPNYSNGSKPTSEQNHAHYMAEKYCVLGPCCEVCGDTENLVRHHPDYSDPLEVMTVCRRCNDEL
jgi:ribosomal protein L44E